MTHRYYSSHDQSNSYSMLFSMPDAEMYPYPSSSSSSVDCTLSLGTPSTRLTCDTENQNHHDRGSGSSRMSSNYWDMVPSPPPTHHHKPSRGTSNGNSSSDPLLARRCANCDTTTTPLWRNGPRGPKSLCNACGIRFKKEERRAYAAAAEAAGAGAAPGVMEHQHMLNNSWVQYSQPQRMQCYSPAMGNEFSFIDGDVSWSLNIADRPSLVHDFTT